MRLGLQCWQSAEGGHGNVCTDDLMMSLWRISAERKIKACSMGVWLAVGKRLM